MATKTQADWEEVFHIQCLKIGLPHLEREEMLVPGRRFRFDFLFPHVRLIVEIEGGTWGGSSRHTSGPGFARDCEKYNMATRLGYEVYRFTSDMVKSGKAVNFMREVIIERENGVHEYPVWVPEPDTSTRKSKHISRPRTVPAS